MYICEGVHTLLISAFIFKVVPVHTGICNYVCECVIECMYGMCSDVNM